LSVERTRRGLPPTCAKLTPQEADYLSRLQE